MQASKIILIAILSLIAIGRLPADKENSPMINSEQTQKHLRDHMHALTVSIGERSVRLPANLKKTADYIEKFYREIGVAVQRQTYAYSGLRMENIIAEISSGARPEHRFVVGAHYDSVAGTVGADDNASAIAVQLEVARHLATLIAEEKLDLAVKFVSFALEEPPVYGTRHMGSRVYAKMARRQAEKIDGMICLEMVGYACHESGCQDYPFPLMFMNYPKKGDFIGIVNNFKSRGFARNLTAQFQKNKHLPVVRLTVPLNGWIMPAVRLSDHASFWDQGFRAVMVTDSAFFRNPRYHTAADTMDTLDYEFMAELVESLLLFFQSFR
jgi:Zn-dependent M28 family amino/carboxypeptidase